MTERWLDIARKDFHYARRSFLVLAVIFIFAFLTFVIVAVPGVIAMAVGEEVDFVEELFGATATASATIVPITALVAAYLSVAGERQTGRIRLLLAMPPTRLDVVVGKFVARSAIIVLGIVVAYAVASVASLVLYQTVPVTDVLWTVLLTSLLGVSFVGIAVGISASTGSRAIAMAIALVFFVLTVVLWSPLVTALAIVAQVAIERTPEWLGFIEVLPPKAIYSELFDSFVGTGIGATLIPGDGFYRSDPFLFALFGSWAVLPVALGYTIFERADLG